MRCSSAISTRMSRTRSRDLEAEQLLDRQAERHAVGLRAQVVHPLDERDDLLPLLLLGRLLDAGVQVADGRRRRQDGLAVELEHQPQHAVRAGVLRPHVDGHRFGADLRHRFSGTRLGRSASARHRRVSRSFIRFARNSSSVTCSGSVVARRHLDLDRIVLAQRIALPVLGHQQPPRIRMAVERRCRTDPRPRARASSPPARRRSPSRRAHRRRAAAPSAAAAARCSIDTRR